MGTVKQTVAVDVNVTVDQATANVDKINKSAKSLGDTVKKANSEFDKLGSVQRAESVLKVSEGIVGGFTAIQGVMGLMGSESEELTKSLLKVQSALAISQGVKMVTEGLHNMGAAFDTVKKAILSNPLVTVLAISIAAVSAALIYLTKTTDEYTASIDKQIEGNTKKFDSIAKRYDREIVLAKAAGESVIGLEKKKLEAVIQRVRKEIELNELKYKHELENAAEGIKATEVFFGKARAKEVVENSSQNQKIKKLKEDLSQFELELDAKVLEEKKANTDKYIAYQKAAFEKKKADDQKLIEDLKQQDEDLNAGRIKEAKKFALEYQKELKTIPQAVAQANEEAIEEQVSAYEKFEAASDHFADFLNGKFSQVSQGITGSIANGLSAATSLYKNAEDKQLKAAEGNESAQEAIKKKFFERNKKVQLAQARIAMFTGAVEAYKSTVGIPVVGPILAPINAAAALIAGKANIESIKRQTYEGGDSGGGGAVNAPSLDGTSGNPGFNEGNTTQINSDGSTGPQNLGSNNSSQNQGALKVFVVASEVDNINNVNKQITKLSTV